MKRIFLILAMAGGLFFPQAHAILLFSDLPPSNDAFEAVTVLQGRGIINGFSDGSFRPEESVSRAAALKIILMASGSDIPTSASARPFPDVDRSDWFAAIAEEGARQGIVKGDADGSFSPGRNVSRAEAIAMLFRTNKEDLKDPTKKPFDDVPLDAWFASYFSAAKNTGLLKGKTADPHHALTRGEISDLTYRFFRNDWKQSDEMNGKASFYGKGFDGRKTANGETFLSGNLVAAHKTLPFGTRVRVTNRDNRKSVVVRIIDRGPYVPGRVIDLSLAAFEVLSPASRGVIPVELSVVTDDTSLGAETECAAPVISKSIERDFFKDIILLQDVPKQFRKNEVVEIRGKVEKEVDEVTVFFGKGDEQKSFRGPVLGGAFRIPVFFDEEGKMGMGIIPGNTGVSQISTILVEDPSCEQSLSESTRAPQNMHIEVQSGAPVLYWDDDINDLFRIQFQQEGKEVEFFVFNAKKLDLPLRSFQHFQEGLATVRIWGALAGSNSLDRQSQWRASEEKKLFLIPHISQKDNQIEAVITSSFRMGDRIIVKGQTTDPLDPKAVIITPDEQIIEKNLEISGQDFSLSFRPDLLGTYMVEVNKTDGLTLFVGASYPEGTTPLLPDFFDLQEVSADIAPKDRNRVLLGLVNKERSSRGISLLQSDVALTSLAQFRADDMCAKNYFGHIDPLGKGANDYRVLHAVQTPVGENIARNRDPIMAHYSLMRSPAHRKLILDESFRRLGTGFCENDDGLLVVEIFGGDPFDIGSLPNIREEVLQKVNDKRTQNPLLNNIRLESVAQHWAQKMADEGFLGFEQGEESFQGLLRDAGIQESARAFVFHLGNIDDLLQEIDQKEVTIGGAQSNFLLEDEYEKMGLGIAQNDAWELFIVVVGTEE